MEIKKLRKQNKLTQKELAEKTGLTREFIARVENETQNPSMKTLKKIASALNTEMRELI